MKKNYLLFVGLLLGLMPAAQAQYEFKSAPDASSNGLGPYEQNFNTLSGTVAFANNTTILGVYAQANVGFPYQPVSFPANDGSNDGEGYYHFGTVGSSDRAFGGIAALSTGNGIGYVGIRFKNSSGKKIINLEVQYAMEQWYNSGRQDAASVSVSYQKGSKVENLLAGAWVDVPELKVDAPSTATVISSRDGNSPSNRRVRQTTIENINLVDGQEVMIRWGYALNTNTNGNGLSIDDVVVTPQTNIFYSKTSGRLDQAANWGTNIDGSGTTLKNFTQANITYYVQGADTAASRIGSGSNDVKWSISGANSKIVVGTATSPAALRIEYNRDVAGRIDVSNGSTLYNRRTGTKSFTLGSLGNTSTVRYDSKTTAHTILPAEYGNLTLSSAGGKELTSNITINGNLDLSKSSSLTLGDYSLTINKGGSVVNSSPTAYVVTDGKGTLRQTVANSGADVLFPVGSSGTSYTPAALQQPKSTTARNEDVFGVRVREGVYEKYDAAGTGTTLIKSRNVDKTWLIDEEVSGGSDATLTLQWNPADENGSVDRTKAHINHYTGGAWDTNTTTAQWGAKDATSPGTAYRVAQSGLTSFSPFGVSFQPGGTLPVTLLAFGAHRGAQQAVVCEWRTAQELNNDHFVVERSQSGTEFIAIGQVSGRGTTSVEQRYQFVDKQAPAGLTYYRLRQVDADGTASYSAVVTVAASAGAQLITVTPNPGTGRYQLMAPAMSRPAQVFNVLGGLVQTVAADGRIDLQAQPVGVYLVRLYLPEGPRTIRVIKD